MGAIFEGNTVNVLPENVELTNILTTFLESGGRSLYEHRPKYTAFITGSRSVREGTSVPTLDVAPGLLPLPGLRVLFLLCPAALFSDTTFPQGGRVLWLESFPFVCLWASNALLLLLLRHSFNWKYFESSGVDPVWLFSMIGDWFDPNGVSSWGALLSSISVWFECTDVSAFECDWFEFNGVPLLVQSSRGVFSGELSDFGGVSLTTALGVEVFEFSDVPAAVFSGEFSEPCGVSLTLFFIGGRACSWLIGGVCTSCTFGILSRGCTRSTGNRTWYTFNLTWCAYLRFHWT